MKVHVVEDEADLQKAASFYLTNDEFEVTKSTSGGTALADIQANKPDVILLDLVLPEKAGIDVLKEVRQAGIETPVIVMTNLPFESINHDELKQLGVKQILIKVHTDFAELSDYVFAAYREVVERNEHHTGDKLQS